jgi:hypothetical protein
MDHQEKPAFSAGSIATVGQRSTPPSYATMKVRLSSWRRMPEEKFAAAYEWAALRRTMSAVGPKRRDLTQTVIAHALRAGPFNQVGSFSYVFVPGGN